MAVIHVHTSELVLMLAVSKASNKTRIALRDYIKQSTGEAPSLNAIYLGLRRLVGRGWVERQQNGRVLTYTLTTDGEKVLANTLLNVKALEDG